MGQTQAWDVPSQLLLSPHLCFHYKYFLVPQGRAAKFRPVPDFPQGGEERPTGTAWGPGQRLSKGTGKV